MEHMSLTGAVTSRDSGEIQWYKILWDIKCCYRLVSFAVHGCLEAN
jgi:hypothetical protein